MDRSNAIEHLLLSRCAKFNGSGDVLQYLEQRYSADASQKNYLVLESTDGGEYKLENVKEQQKDSQYINQFLFSKGKALSKENKFNHLKTKNEFKKFIQESLKLQEGIAKKLHKMARKNPKILQVDVASLPMCKKVLRFEDFIEMNNLWKDYMRELLEGSRTIEVATAKLASAEYVGAFFKVTHSSCPTNIGLEGIVLWESQSYFLMIVPRKNNWKDDISFEVKIPYSANECLGGLKMIPKKNTRFTFSIEWGCADEVIDFELVGDRLSIRSLDRANKKFKSHNVKDIEL